MGNNVPSLGSSLAAVGPAQRRTQNPPRHNGPARLGAVIRTWYVLTTAGGSLHIDSVLHGTQQPRHTSYVTAVTTHVTAQATSRHIEQQQRQQQQQRTAWRHMQQRQRQWQGGAHPRRYSVAQRGRLAAAGKGVGTPHSTDLVDAGCDARRGTCRRRAAGSPQRPATWLTQSWLTPTQPPG